MQTVKKDLRSRNDLPDDRREEVSHPDGLIDDDSIVDDGSDGGGVLDDSDDSVVDGYGDHDDTAGHDSSRSSNTDDVESGGYSEVPPERDAQYYVDES